MRFLLSLLNLLLILCVGITQAMLTPEQLSNAAAIGDMKSITNHFKALEATNVFALENALKNEQLKVAEFFLEQIKSYTPAQKANVNYIALSKPYSPEYLSLLQKIVTKTKYDPNAVPPSGESALEYAIKNQRKNMITNLLALGASPLLRNTKTQITNLESAKEKFPESLPTFMPYIINISSQLSKPQVPGSEGEENNKILSRRILGLSEDFTHDNLKKAYIEESKKWHFDRNRILANSIDNFSEFSSPITLAYDLLKKKTPQVIPTYTQQETTSQESTTGYSQTNRTKRPAPSSSSCSSTSSNTECPASNTGYTKIKSVQDILNAGKPIYDGQYYQWGRLENLSSLAGIENIPNKQQYTMLSLTNGNFPTIHTNQFQDFYNLKDLNLSYGNLSDLQLYHPQLEELDLTYNKLSDVRWNRALNLPNLKKLNITHNDLTQITEEDFTNIPNIEKLDLSNNKLSYIAPGAFSKLNKLQDLDLRRNPLEQSRADFLKTHPELKKIKLQYPSSTTKAKRQKTGDTTSFSSTDQNANQTMPGSFNAEPSTKAETPKQFEITSNKFEYDNSGNIIGQQTYKHSLDTRLSGSPYDTQFWKTYKPLISNNKILGFESADGTHNLFTQPFPDQEKMQKALLETQLFS